MDTDWLKAIVHVVDDAELRSWNDQTWALNIICFVGRENGAEFFSHLEHTFYPPGSDGNDQFTLAVYHWHDAAWVICRIPLRDRQKADAACKATGMRLANGTPMVMELAPGAHALMSVRYDRVADADKALIRDRFPLSNARSFVLENDHGPGQHGVLAAVAVVVPGQSKQQFEKNVAAAAADTLRTVYAAMRKRN